MDDPPSGVESSRSLVPSRLLDPQALRRPAPRSGVLARFGVVLAACALSGAGAGLFLLRPSRSPLVVAQDGHARPPLGDFTAGSAAPFQGAGAWVDVWDYATTYQDPGEAPVVGPADVAAMAASGARTLYLQTAGEGRTVGPTEDPGQLGRFLAAAHARGVRVVGWYAPSLHDPSEDLVRLLTVAHFSAGGEHFDGLAVDVDVDQTSPKDRSQLLALSRRLRAEAGPRFPLALIVPPTAALEQAELPFPWRPLDRLYDAWIPRIAWTPGGEDRAGPAARTRSSVVRLRELVGDPGAAVHPLGGMGGAVTESEARAFLRAAADTGAIGASVYDFRSTPAGTQSEIGIASAGGFGDRELSE
ncbi:MAG: hypothetical protein ACRD0O_18900 [Acidimicrobiia bacterium]